MSVFKVRLDIIGINPFVSVPQQNPDSRFKVDIGRRPGYICHSAGAELLQQVGELIKQNAPVACIIIIYQ